MGRKVVNFDFQQRTERITKMGVGRHTGYAFGVVFRLAEENEKAAVRVVNEFSEVYYSPNVYSLKEVSDLAYDDLLHNGIEIFVGGNTMVEGEEYGIFALEDTAAIDDQVDTFRHMLEKLDDYGVKYEHVGWIHFGTVH